MEPVRGASDAAPSQLEMREREARRIQELYAEVIRVQLESEAHAREVLMREEDKRFRGVPASTKAILSLRAPEMSEMAGQDCAVCLDDFKEGDTLRMMPCSHSFHRLCIFKWLRASGACPCCRFKLPTEDEQRLLDEQEAAAQAGAGVAAIDG